MSNKLYPKSEERVNFYKYSEEMLSVPSDYFEEIKKGLYSELAQGYVQTKVCLAHHMEIAQEIEELRKLIAFQDSRLHQLEKDKLNLQAKVVVLEEVSKEEAKDMVENYFKVHGSADIEELMLNLRIPIQTIVEIIDELHDEGKLAPQGENAT